MSDNIKNDNSKILELFAKIDWDKFLLLGEEQLTDKNQQLKILNNLNGQ